MSILLKSLDQLTTYDFQSLVDNCVPESMNLEYKEQLSLDNRDEKKEFLADVTAMANAGGGAIVYGIAEERENGKPTGRPISMVGIETNNADALIQSIENLLRDGVRPAISNLSITPYHIADDRYVILFRIPFSLTSPHMITFAGQNTFYTRHSGGKHPMEVGELRTAFLSGAHVVQKVEDWRDKRLEAISINKGIIQLEGDQTARLVVHLVPLSSFDPLKSLSIELLKQASERHIKTLLLQDREYIYNLHGYLTFRKVASYDKPVSYVQFFRNGQIEAVTSYRLLPNHQNQLLFPIDDIEEDLIKKLTGYFMALEEVENHSPVLLSVSLVNTNGYRAKVENDRIIGNVLSEETLLLPNRLVDTNEDKDIQEILRPVFDSLWNAIGYSESPNFNSQGMWRKSSN